MTVSDPAVKATTPGADGRQRIMDAAAELFLRQGYPETSLRHIAGAAGMKAGSLYYHFDSKDDLLTSILRQGIAVMVDAFDTAALNAATASPPQLIATRPADPRGFIHRSRRESHQRPRLSTPPGQSRTRHG